jgi:hypothetical protein
MHRLLPLLALLCACAPTQRRLLGGRNYPEALAGVEQGALDGGVVLTKIAADLAPGIHLQALSPAELKAQLPGQPEGLGDLALVRVIHDSNQLTLPSYGVSFALLQADVPVAPVDTSILALARRTGEALPDTKTIDHPADNRYAVVSRTRFPGLELLGRLAVNIITVGLIHPVVPLVENKGTSAYTERIEPSEDDYARVTPGAESLRRWLIDPGCDGLGARCERWLLWPRAAEPRTLTVVVHLDTLDPPALIYPIPLPPGPLEDSLRARFGDRVQTLDALTRAAGARPQLSFPIKLRFDSLTHALTRQAKKSLCRAHRGTRRHPGLQGRPGLRFTIEIGAHATHAEQEALALRSALLACGVTTDQIELAEDPYYSVDLRVRHDLPAAP